MGGPNNQTEFRARLAMTSPSHISSASRKRQLSKMRQKLIRVVTKLERRPKRDPRIAPYLALNAILYANKLSKLPYPLKSELEANTKQISGLNAALRIAKQQPLIYQGVRKTLLQTLRRTCGLLRQVEHVNNSASLRLPRGYRARVRLKAIGSDNFQNVATRTVNRIEQSPQEETSIIGIGAALNNFKKIVNSLLANRVKSFDAQSKLAAKGAANSKIYHVAELARSPGGKGRKIQLSNSKIRHIDGFVAPFSAVRCRIKARAKIDRFEPNNREQVKNYENLIKEIMP